LHSFLLYIRSALPSSLRAKTTRLAHFAVEEFTDDDDDGEEEEFGYRVTEESVSTS
jgi:hypothetical protein